MVDDVYLDDHERAERVKQWWKQNAPSIIGGAVLGLVAIFGWRAWQTYQAEQAAVAAAQFEQFTQRAQALSTEEVSRRVEEFKSEFGGTPYASMAALKGASLQYETGNIERAMADYRYVIEKGEPKRLRDVARLRLARLQLDQDELDAALQTLSVVNSPEFAAAVDELRGDVLVRQGRLDEARAAYESAREAAGPAGSRFLDLKITSIGSGILAPGTEEKKNS